MASAVADLAKVGIKAASEALEKPSAYRSIEYNLSRTEEGRDVLGLFKDYRQKQDQIFTKLHGQATQDIAAGKLTKMPESSELLHQSRTTARALAFGQNDKALTYLVHNSHINNGHIATQNLMDNIAMYLHEDQTIEGRKHQSIFLERAKQTIEKNDPRYKSARKMSKEAEIPLDAAMKAHGINFYNTTSDYHAPGTLERRFTNLIYSRFSPLIAIPHLGTILNVVQSTQTKSLVKAMAETITPGNLDKLKAQHAASGVFAEDALRGMRAIEDSRNGFVTKYAPRSVQNIIGKVTSTPGFNYVRDWQLAFSASASFHDSQNYAAKLARGEEQHLAEARLRQYGMRDQDIAQIKSTGQLSDEQLERATWNGVDRKIFLDTQLNRAYSAQKNPWTRAFTMYHGYVSNQAKFMSNELKLAFSKDTRSFSSIAKAVSVMGVMFPAAGESLKMLEMVGRGQWNSIPNELKEDEEGISFQRGDSLQQRAYHFAGTYLDAMAHLGAFGIAFELIQSAQRGYLLEQMAGPLVGSGAKYAQDAYRVGDKLIQGATPNYTPLGRDALEITMPLGIGRYAKHALLPTKKEQEQAKRGNRLHKLKVKGLKNLSKLQ